MIVSRLPNTDAGPSTPETFSALSPPLDGNYAKHESALRLYGQERLIAYWHEIRGARPVPSKQDIDMARIAALLPYIILFAVEYEPVDFVYRIMGAETLRNVTANFTGKHMSEIPGKGRDSRIFQSLSRVLETKQAEWLQVPYVGPHRQFKSVRSIALPFADDYSTIDRIMVMINFFASR